MADGFLGRWSQRKQAVREGKLLPEPESKAAISTKTSGSEIQPKPSAHRPPPSEPAAEAKARPSTAVPSALEPRSSKHKPLEQQSPELQGAGAPEVAPVQEPALTLQDTEQLTDASDFSPFVKRDVAPEVRNAAVKKLFADPRYNVMDGLDTYIDDYSQPDPLPLSMLKQMASAQFLNLVETPPTATSSHESALTPEIVPEPVTETSAELASPPDITPPPA